MNVLYGTDRGYPPDVHGGSSKSVHTILKRLNEQGHICQVVAPRRPGAISRLCRLAYHLSGKRWLGFSDLDNGYKTYRTAPDHLAKMLVRKVDQFRPDLLLLDSINLVKSLVREAPHILELPIIYRIAGVKVFKNDSLQQWAGKSILLISNSEFISKLVRQHFGLESPVLYPPVELQQYLTNRAHPEYVTMINFIEGKGGALVLDIARLLPKQKFLLVEGYWSGPYGSTSESLLAKMRLSPNVELHSWTPDLRPIFSRTAVLLVPTRWEEPFGRVVLEAQVNGIPVIATRSGGLPEAVGGGGRLIPPSAPPEVWAQSLDELLSDRDLYNEMSKRACENVKRAEFNPEAIVERFVDLATAHINKLPL